MLIKVFNKQQKNVRFLTTFELTSNGCHEGEGCGGFAATSLSFTRLFSRHFERSEKSLYY